MKTQDPAELQAALNSGEIRKVLFVRPGRVGDLLFISPLLRKFKERYPRVSLSVLVSCYSSAAVHHHPLLETVVTFDPKAPRLMRWLENRRLRAKIRELKPDLAIVLSRKGKEARHLAKAGVPRLYCFSEAQLDSSEDEHVIEQLMHAIEALGVAGPPGALEIYYSDRDKTEIDAFLLANGIAAEDRFAVLHPGCFQVHSHKVQTFSARRLWPLANFKKLGQRLHDQFGLKIVLSGTGPRESRMIEVLNSGLTFEAALGTQLGIPQLACLLQRASLLVTVDTGPMHIGAAMGTPLVALFGPSPVHYTRPWREEKVEILRRDLPCSPCRGKGISCYDNICMKQITVDDAVAAAAGLLEPGNSVYPACDSVGTE